MATLAAIRDQIPAGYVLPLSYNQASKMFAIVRDVVLEEAAKACEGAYAGDDDLDPVDADMAIESCAAAVRALKGTT